jgi:alpha-galactosidase
VLALSVLAFVQGNGLRLELDEQMRSRVVATEPTEQVLGPFAASETLLTPTGEVDAFAYEDRHEDALHDVLGDGVRVTLTGHAGSLAKILEVSSYEQRPGWLFLRARYRNDGATPVDVQGYTLARYTFDAPRGTREPAFWSYQSASYESRPDWVQPVPRGYGRPNFLGMNAADYGGGTPVLDVWRRDVGLAIGHVELVPKQVSLPLRRDRTGAAIFGLGAERKLRLEPGASFDTVRGFVAVHHGDYFTVLRAYSQLMQDQGLKLANAPADAYEPIWCAWGYGREFTPAQVFETLPVAKRLGFRWAVLDDGWQTAIGDWTPVATKFPNGDADMKALVDRIHQAGLKAQLWWAPLAAAPASRTHVEHTKWLLENEDGTPRDISWWDSHYLCPAYEPVRADAAAFVRKVLTEWGFDGLKVDGQHLNAAPPCYNAAHGHASPEDAPEGIPGFFETLWNAAQASKPGALVEICPCGTGYSFFTLPYLNMMVASDPESSWQVRSKGKTLKALAGDQIAYFGDHVEMSEGGEDFASTFGVGGVIGTNFAWPGAPGKKDKTLLLTPKREALWAEWTRLYAEKRLSEGEYLGQLYDLGFDRPEAHVVRKDGTLYYAFFAKHYDGRVELRGLDPGSYEIVDYVHDRSLGRVESPGAMLRARFDHALLVEARPVSGN